LDSAGLDKFFPASPALVVRLQDQARDFAKASKSASTRRAYARAWRDFEIWCAGMRAQSLPVEPDMFILYVTHLANKPRSVSTIQQTVVAVSEAHRLKGLKPPTADEKVRAVWAGIRRTKSVAPKQKAALSTIDLRKMLNVLPDGSRGCRDRAVLLLGFAGAFRRSEIAELDTRDISLTDDGLIVTLRRSKTDQEGEGRRIGIPFGLTTTTCPVLSLQHWLRERGTKDGPLFFEIDWDSQMTLRRMSGRAIARAVKRYGKAVGLDPTLLAGHSLRSGFATQAARNGASESAIMAQTGHRSSDMVRRYIRLGTLWHENAAKTLGL
jgi:integrase